MGKSNGTEGPSTSKSARNLQRIGLLVGDEHSEVKSVLAEYPGARPGEGNANEEAPQVCRLAHGEVRRGRVAGRAGLAAVPVVSAVKLQCVSINWAVLFNSDAGKDGKQFMIDPLLHKPADEINNWPDIDLFQKF